MLKNIGTIDKVVRLILVAVAAILIATQVVLGTFAIIAGVLGGILLLTSLVGLCPLYRLLGVSSAKKSV